mgnify:CR=1 FL=1
MNTESLHTPIESTEKISNAFFIAEQEIRRARVVARAQSILELIQVRARFLPASKRLIIKSRIALAELVIKSLGRGAAYTSARNGHSTISKRISRKVVFLSRILPNSHHAINLLTEINPCRVEENLESFLLSLYDDIKSLEFPNFPQYN